MANELVIQKPCLCIDVSQYDDDGGYDDEWVCICTKHIRGIADLIDEETLKTIVGD